MCFFSYDLKLHGLAIKLDGADFLRTVLANVDSNLLGFMALMTYEVDADG